MPFGNRLSPEEQQRRMQEQQDAEASQRLLETGSLPLRAKQRLSIDLATGHPLFSSNLSTSEFALTSNQGYQPLSQVMGSSIYHIGRRDPYLSNIPMVEATSDGEAIQLTAAHQRAARLALGRLEEEALLLKAHGVIGVHFTERSYEWGQNMLEYTAIGTAIRLPNTPLPQHPFLSDLSGQEFWTLLQAGYSPLGVVTGYCAYYVHLSAVATKQLRGSWMNVEIVPFSNGIYQARSLAMRRAAEMARQLNASGVVGMHMKCERELEEEERDRLSLWVRFSVVGTAIGTQKVNHVIPKPQPTLSLTDVRPGQRGETRERLPLPSQTGIQQRTKMIEERLIAMIGQLSKVFRRATSGHGYGCLEWCGCKEYKGIDQIGHYCTSCHHLYENHGYR